MKDNKGQSHLKPASLKSLIVLWSVLYCQALLDQLLVQVLGFDVDGAQAAAVFAHSMTDQHEFSSAAVHCGLHERLGLQALGLLFQVPGATLPCIDAIKADSADRPHIKAQVDAGNQSVTVYHSDQAGPVCELWGHLGMLIVIWIFPSASE